MVSEPLFQLLLWIGSGVGTAVQVKGEDVYGDGQPERGEAEGGPARRASSLNGVPYAAAAGHSAVPTDLNWPLQEILSARPWTRAATGL